MRTEAELVSEIRGVLQPQFWLLPEACLRDPLSGIDLRVDFLVWPRSSDFSLDLFAVEVKGEDCDGSDLTQALKQCVDYKRSVVVDERCVQSHGLMPAAVFLYRGHSLGIESGPPARYGAIRLAGKLNVGEAVHHERHGLRLEIGETPIWSEQKGITGQGVAWPQHRRVGNSRRRAA